MLRLCARSHGGVLGRAALHYVRGSECALARKRARTVMDTLDAVNLGTRLMSSAARTCQSGASGVGEAGASWTGRGARNCVLHLRDRLPEALCADCGGCGDQ